MLLFRLAGAAERWQAGEGARSGMLQYACLAAAHAYCCGTPLLCAQLASAALAASPCLACPPLPLQVYQTVVRQLGPDHPGYIDAVVALAEQHRELGQAAEADR